MGVRCKLLGHIRDSTEFEERREKRPTGTVLVCREYQVCRRCGDREELYRNEQVLEQEAAADSPPVEATDGADPSEDAGEGVEDVEQATERAVGNAAEHDPQDVTVEESADVTPGESAEVLADDPAGVTPTSGSDQPGSDDGQGESEDASADAGGSSTAADVEGVTADAAGADTTDEDAVILSDSTTDAGTPATDADTLTTEADTSPADTPASVRTDGTGPSPTASGDDGSRVWQSDDGDDDPAKVHCNNCGAEWRRDETSLRDGDICPECRGAYVEGP